MLILLTCLALGLGTLTGCSKENAGEVVEGTVTLDGQPLPAGRIDFIPVDGQSPTAGAEIKEGKFQATVMPGIKRVNITADKVTGQQKAYPGDPNSPVFDIKEQYIPARYNNNSELKCEVKSGTNTSNFDLQSDPAKQ
jgi:hypothetical protein